MVDAAKAMLNRYRTEFGMKESQLSDADRKAWTTAMPNFAQAWAKARNDAGQPGTEILSLYMGAMRTANQSILRNWDKE
ncbi:MAG: hypothetical protein ACPGQM_09640 [Alphaproteobacteria bacterium]